MHYTIVDTCIQVTLNDYCKRFMTSVMNIPREFINMCYQIHKMCTVHTSDFSTLKIHKIYHRWTWHYVAKITLWITSNNMYVFIHTSVHVFIVTNFTYMHGVTLSVTIQSITMIVIRFQCKAFWQLKCYSTQNGGE